MEPTESLSESAEARGTGKAEHARGGRAPGEQLSARPHSGAYRQPGYGLVLLAIVLAIVILVAAGDAALGRFLALVVLAAAMLLALRTAQVPDQMQRRAAILVGLAVMSALASLLTSRVAIGLENMLILVLVGITPIVLARRLVQNPEVTVQTLLGALSVYLLLGLFFAFVLS
jgi:hypothetical protein